MPDQEGTSIDLLANNEGLELFSALGFAAGAWQRLSGRRMAGTSFAGSVTLAANTTLNTADHPPGILLKCVSAGNFTVTVPPDSSYDFPIGGRIMLIRGSTGQITIDEGSGVFIYFGNNNRDKFNDVASVCWLIKTGANEWAFTGDTSAT